jgi:hypothetical protein
MARKKKRLPAPRNPMVVQLHRNPLFKKRVNDDDRSYKKRRVEDLRSRDEG